MRSTPPAAQVANLIIHLAADDSAPSSDLSTYTHIFSQHDEGTLFLDGEDTALYLDTLQSLVLEFGKSEDISNRTIEQALQQAIFAALDIKNKRRTMSLEERIESATIDLVERLTQATKTFDCYVPICGLEPDVLPSRFGCVKFVRFSEVEIARFNRAVRRHAVSAEQKRLRRRLLLQDVKRSSTWNNPCAHIPVKAKDPEAALALAEREVRTTIDAMNFLLDLVPYNSGWLYLPSDTESTVVMSPILGEDGSFSLQRRRLGPVAECSLSKLWQTEMLKPFARRIDSLLRTDRRSEIQDVLLAAVRWAGRACVEPRREEAFVLFAIALESIVLPRVDVELGYRLRLRTAHLLASTLVERSRLSKEIADLYGIRSRIVHSGYYRVTDAELARIQFLARRVIFMLLRNRSIPKLGTRKELDQWFEDKLLA